MSKMQPVGPGQAAIVCPYCQSAGYVTAMRGKKKRGVSGGKATAALFTLGGSLIFTGLSRKENVTSLSCNNCGVSWDA